MGQEARDWMKVPEAAEYFCVPRSRMYELIQRGELPAVRIGERSIRVNRREAERFLWENRAMDDLRMEETACNYRGWRRNQLSRKVP